MDTEKIIKFGSDTKYRKQWFTSISFSHPAKMNLLLQEWIINNFTKEGEIILDPMAGIGTILMACSKGRNIITVELEDKFVQMQNGNWEKIRQRGPQLGYQMGMATILQGDARNLEGLLVDKCIFSPPFANATTFHDFKFMHETAQDQRERRMKGIIKGHNFTAKARQRAMRKAELGVIEDKDNIGNLPYGSIDSVIASPPYEATVSDNKEGPLAGGKKESYGRWSEGTAKKTSYTQHGEPVDSIITSPPYEAAVRRGDESPLASGKDRPTYQKRLDQSRVYSNERDNIGNLRADSYLAAMLQVYQQCHKVLRAGGLMILVTKNFIRNKKQVRLDLDTIKLCEQAGFIFKDRFYRELVSQSFWRVIYHQKYPDVEPIKFEDILIFQK